MVNPHRASNATNSESPEPCAEVVELSGSLPGGFELGAPVRAEVWLENDEYVADVAELNLHAFGATRAEALDNLRGRIVDERSRLLSLRHRLSPLMEHAAARLEALVLPPDA